MTRVHITGEDVGCCRDSLKWLRPDGYDRLASPDSAAVQILAEVDHGVVVLLRPQTGCMDAGGFLSAASAHDDVWWRHRFVLLDGEPGRLPADVERRSPPMGGAHLIAPPHTPALQGHLFASEQTGDRTSA